VANTPEAPIARTAPDGVREPAMARWGMPGPPAFGGAPITNIRNVKSPHWRPWLKPETVAATHYFLSLYSTSAIGAVGSSRSSDSR
jgi:putative SOS response-associated peptidase YedK